MNGMSKKKSDDQDQTPKRPTRPDQHKSPHLVRLTTDVYKAMKALADESERPLTREIKLALIAWLEAKGKWPPSASST